MTKISKRIVDAERPGKSVRFIWDSTLSGFGLRILPSGVKAFIFQYRTAEGRTRRATVAKVGAMTPEQARDLAEDWAAMVKRGGDPLADKAAARAALTVGQLLDRYLESEKFNTKAESTRLTDKGRIERHLRPLLGGRHVHKLASEDIRRAFSAIRDGKTAGTFKTGPHGLARVKGGEGAARKSVRLLSAIFSWGIAEKMIENNPAQGVEVGQDGERDTIIDADEYTRLFKTLSKMEAEKRLRSPVADAIRIIALTGARRSEIAGLRWRHVDMKSGTITLPTGAHKTGRKTGKPRVITLPAVAQEIVARQPDGKPDEFVFAPYKGTGAINLNQPWRSIRSEAKLPDGIGLHGLRHTLATLLAVGGAQAAEIMASLGHRSFSTSQKYIHFANQARSVLAERAAAPVLAGMAAASGEPSADVVDIKKGRR